MKAITLDGENAGVPSVRPMLAAGSLCWREIVRFLRQRNRVIGALGQPIVFWLLFGAGLDRSFQLSPAGDDQSFREYFFPGTLMLIVLFTAIFATISIIEDRREGFLQSVLVSPAPRWAMVLGKVLGGTALAVGQGLLFLVLALTLDIETSLWQLVLLTLLLTASSLALTSLGFVIAWRMDSTQGFHAIMNLFLMPLWLLSGAFFPPPAADAAASWSAVAMHWVMRLNPMSYAVSGARQLLGQPEMPDQFWAPEMSLCWLVTLAFAAVMFAAACWMARRPAAGDLL